MVKTTTVSHLQNGAERAEKGSMKENEGKIDREENEIKCYAELRRDLNRMELILFSSDLNFA